MLYLNAARAEEVPSSPLASKGELIFSDDFSKPELGKEWKIQWPGFTVVDGALKASQTKPEHSAVGMVPVGRKDIIIAFKFQLNGATGVNAVFNDSGYKEGHGGHICRVSLSPRQIFLADDKERLREGAKKVPGQTLSVPIKLDPTRSYQILIEIIGDNMHVTLDGKSVGQLKSPGIGHPMKTDFYFAVSGEAALFDDLRIWNAVPAAAK